MADRSLRPHGGSSVLDLTTEAQVVDYIEELRGEHLTLHILEQLVNKCVAGGFHYGLVFLGDFLMRSLSQEPDSLYNLVQHVLDPLCSGLSKCVLTTSSSVEEIHSVVQSALEGEDAGGVEGDVDSSTLQVLELYSTLLNEVAEHYHQPCMQRMEGNGFATWLDQKAHMGDLLHCTNPKFSQFLPLIYFLAKKSFMDCSSTATEDADVPMFDQKWDMWLEKFPLLGYVAGEVPSTQSHANLVLGRCSLGTFYAMVELCRIS